MSVQGDHNLGHSSIRLSICIFVSTLTGEPEQKVFILKAKPPLDPLVIMSKIITRSWELKKVVQIIINLILSYDNDPTMLCPFSWHL